MAEKISIDLDLGELVQEVKQATKEGDELDQAIRDWRKQQSRNRALAQMAAAYGPKLEELAPAPKILTPEQLQDQRIAAWRKARSRGRALAQMEAEENPPPPPSRFFQALGQVQFGAGAMGAHGVSGAAGSIGQFAQLFAALPVPLKLVSGALIGLGAAAMAAQKRLAEIGTTAMATGGTGGQVGAARVLAAAVGMDPGQLTGLAHAHIQALSQGGLAAASFGFAAPRELSAQNEMARLLQDVGKLIRATPEEAQKMIAREGNMEPFMALRALPPEMLQRIQQLGQAMGQVATPEATGRAMIWNAQLALFRSQWDELLMKLGGPILSGISKLLEKLGLGGKKTAEQQAEDERVTALKENSRELRMTREGMFGGGPRAQAAIPSGLRGIALNEALNRQAIRLGAF